MSRWRRAVRGATLVGAAVALAVSAASGQTGWGSWGQAEREYDGLFTFVRLRWDSRFGSRRGFSSAWNHDFPRAEQNLLQILSDLTLIDTNTTGSLILRLDDPQLFKYPIVYMWEPGFWTMSDFEAQRFREYLLKGGFAIFDDFELDQWNNFEAQMRRVLPELRWVKLDQSHQVFDGFFRMKTIEFPHPMMGLRPSYYGLHLDNDPTKRLLVIANHNADVAEYWEFVGRGFFPVDSSNEAFKLGVNYMIYGLTH